MDAGPKGVPVREETRLRPARPHTELTEDGRQVSQVLTYALRGSRLSGRQAAAWDRHAREWWIRDDAVDSADFDFAGCFGREAPLIVEIGSGIGEATAALAAARPSYNVLALEVWRPGVADTFLHLERTGATNVRLLSVDAVWAMEQLVVADSVSELWTFFPDPWPKNRHQRRRLVTPPFARLAASRLAPGALWRLATDWPDYAAQIAAVLSDEPMLEKVHAGSAPRWDARPRTRFERRGICAGRPIEDFVFRRT